MRLKIYNLYRQVASLFQLDFADKYITYGIEDAFPLKRALIVKQSPSATSCISTVCDFIEGDGLNDQDLANRIVNDRGETFAHIHSLTSQSLGENEGFYWLFKYNGMGAITNWYVLPFENCRLGQPDDTGFISKVHYNPFFGTDEYSSKKKYTQIYDIFQPQAVPAQLLEQKDKYKGQVFFYGTTTALNRFYPVPEYFSAKDAMEAEAAVEEYNKNDVTNGLVTPFMLLMKGNPDEPSGNPALKNHNGEGKPATLGQEADLYISENFQGSKRVGNLWLQWVNQGEEAPEVLALPSTSNEGKLNFIATNAKKSINIATKVPSVLANMQEGASLGGDGNEIRAAVKLMQSRVIKKQRLLTDSYSRALKLFVKPYLDEIRIVPYNPFPELQKVDPEIWDTLSVEEKRKWIKDNTDIELIEENENLVNPSPAAKFTNAIPLSFPEKSLKNIQKSLEYMDKMGVKCGGKPGKEVAQGILDGKPMGLRQVKRIYSYLKKNEVYSNKTFSEGCEVILYNAWGGKEMFDYLESKMEEIEKWLN